MKSLASLFFAGGAFFIGVGVLHGDIVMMAMGGLFLGTGAYIYKDPE